MTRTPLKDRVLPDYTRGEDIANMVTHIVGGAVGVAVLVLSVVTAALHRSTPGVICASIYGVSMVALYTVSSVYHGLLPGMGKKVMQVIDHCMIYFLIVGTYTPILLVGIYPLHPMLAAAVLGAEWGLAAVAVVFTAIDHNRYRRLSMVCYIGMGWGILAVLGAAADAVDTDGLLRLFAGGVAYTAGAVLYGIGKSRPIFHTVFHVFTVVGSILQAACILRYVL